MMMESFATHWVGNVLIIAIFGLGTVACFVAALLMLVRPGEADRHHPKYQILDEDR